MPCRWRSRRCGPRLPPGDRRGLPGGAEGVVQAAPRPGPDPQPGRLPAARRALRPGPRRPPEGDLRSSGRQDPGAGLAVRCCRAGPRRARRRVPRRPAPPGCPAARHQEEAGRRGQGLRHQPHRRSSASAPSSPGPSSATSAMCPGSPAAITSPPITAPPRSRCPRGTGRSTGCRCAATGASTTRSTWPRSPSSGTSTARAAPTTTRKLAEGKTHKEALRSLKRKISDAIFARLQADARQAAAARAKGPGGQPGNDSDSSAAGSHPERRLFGPATPGPDTTIRPATTAGTPSPPKPTSKKTRPAT